ncbi:MAG: magnesium transporter CorA [Rhizobiaceae bacterium]|nr:magnesium transporter CorA [Rhizobiaceae bacterium]
MRTDDASAAAWSWYNYSLADARARRAIEFDQPMPSAARQSLLSSADVLHLDTEDDWLFGEIVDTRHKHYTDTDEIGNFRFAFDARVLVSARRHPLQSVDDVRRLVEQGKKAFSSPARLVETVVQRSLARLSGDLVTIGDEIDAIEESIVGDTWKREADRLAKARRRLVFIHRHVAATVSLFRHLENTHGATLPDDVADLVAALSQRATALLHDSEQLQSRARLLQDELMAKLTMQSNNLLYILSVLTAVLLPMTIISGLFGMNVGGLPFLDNSAGFWIVAALSVLAAAAVLVFLRRLSR